MPESTAIFNARGTVPGVLTGVERAEEGVEATAAGDTSGTAGSASCRGPANYKQ
jgi:hypothetical protein